MSALYTCDKPDCGKNIPAEEVNKVFIGYDRTKAEIEQLMAARPGSNFEQMREASRIIKSLDYCPEHYEEFKKQF